MIQCFKFLPKTVRFAGKLVMNDPPAFKNQIRNRFSQAPICLSLPSLNPFPLILIRKIQIFNGRYLNIHRFQGKMVQGFLDTQRSGQTRKTPAFALYFAKPRHLISSGYIRSLGSIYGSCTPIRRPGRVFMGDSGFAVTSRTPSRNRCHPESFSKMVTT